MSRYCWPCFWGGSVGRVGVHVTTPRALDPISAADSLIGQDKPGLQFTL
jgi:hypothetical protein